MLLLIFIVVLAISLGIQLYVLKSSKTEKALEQQLANILETRKAGEKESTILKEERLSPVPWIHDVLARIPLSLKWHYLIKQAGVKWWVSSLVLSTIALAFGGTMVAAIWIRNPVIILAAGFVVSAIPYGYLSFLRHRKLQVCAALLPQAVELMARALKAGHALNSALEMVSQDIPEPLATEFRIVHEQQNLGLPLRDALINLSRRIPENDMRFLTSALLLQKETGGNLVQILETTSSLVRQRVRTRKQIRIYTAQARASAWVVGLMPALLFIILSLYDPSYETVLLTDPTGSRVFGGCLVLLMIGVVLIRKIVSTKV